MKRLYIVFFVLLLFLCSVAQAADMGDSLVVQKEKGLIDWTNSYIESRGTAVAPEGAKGAQAKLLAQRGAMLDLQRNMLEFMAGVQVDARSTMDDFMASDSVRSEVHGIIKDLETISGEWDGESYTITGRIQIAPIRRVVVQAMPQAPAPAAREEQKSAPAAAKKTRYTGLVIDVRHLPYKPAMTFSVYDQNGKLVYGIDSVDQKRFMQSGLCTYQTNIEYAKGEPSIASSPIVAKAVKLDGGSVDIVISNADAKKIRSSTYDFRKDCKVILVSK